MKQITQSKRKTFETHTYLDPDLFAQLERAAKKEDRSMTAMVRVLIKEALMARKGKG